MKYFQTLPILIGSILLSSVICRADTVAINLGSAVLSGEPGSELTFSGTLTNTTAATAFLNSAGLNLAGPFDPADENTAPFFDNAPNFLAATASTTVIDLFTIYIPASIPTGAYTGTFTVLGGTDGAAQDTLGSAAFSVQVVPEPSPAALWTVAALMALILRALWKQSMTAKPLVRLICRTIQDPTRVVRSGAGTTSTGTSALLAAQRGHRLNLE